MDFSFGDRADGLRTRLRELIAEHLPADFLSPFTDDPEDFALTERFCRVLGEEHLLALAWPREYGGGGGGVWEQTVVREEMWAHYEPRGPQYMGLNWVGPALMRFGTPAQQERYLPRIAQGEVVWCQGFSEPEAGSDLAALKTQARPDGDGWRVDGQKIWTSYAQMAEVCVLLARTGRDGPRQQGLTLFLLPMDRPGIEVRPIDSLLGAHHVNEVFLTDVVLEPGDVLGEVDQGWRIVREMLAHERVGIARYARCDRLLVRHREALGADWEQLPQALRARYVRALVHARVARLLAYQVIEEQSRELVDDADTAAARLATTRLDQEVGEVLMEGAGAGALAPTGHPAAPLYGAVEDHYRYAFASTIASGTSEVMSILMARAIFGGDDGTPTAA
ncbi:acyl-CoA dehydrogenase family protein [Conexibacter sp. JD483]|uniref:acyl-CoA dehydrogenase family protein n=1 Tax=unclassified Conexibacter TaxID=2627773 RepID=UPI002726DF86|nr:MULTISPECIES: acyl-CoA dehydrogenase family protein [unclassified Conexibacter]MDO8189148.1 acyl-CoA dehydrogenase family protein [Conexibacter sp. CPCC 205706]MDO8200755.1 acyl-CoA dehydrogenase family protein [Conexibacter sp. CPCC 205762]MDR9373083.1 acyl-CoA dehydrogenase family protein [Conexibacter sp. JD483]